jgi:acetoin utilization protein AcuB
VAVLEVKQILYHLGRVEIQAIMSVDLVTVPQDFTVDETAQVLLKHKISGCPVVDDTGALVGVITRNDLFKAMISLSGAPQLGIQFGFLLKDRAGSLQELVDVIRDHNARLVSIMSTYDHAPPGFRYTYIRVFSVDRQKLVQLKEKLREKAEILYIVDHREKTREVYAAPLNSGRSIPEAKEL